MRIAALARPHRYFLLRPRWFLILGFIGSVAIALAFFFWLRPSPPPYNPGRDRTIATPWRAIGDKDKPARDPSSDPDRPFNAAGIEKPTVFAADAVALIDEEPVIGIIVRGHGRAYLREALSRGAARHIVNDVVATVPVSVTYCDLDDCVRVFAGETSESPLPLAQGGRRGGQMVLKIGKRMYGQQTEAPFDADVPPFPYANFPAEKTTWGPWRQQHPDTDIYLGDFPPKPGDYPRSTADTPTPLAPFIVASAIPLILGGLVWILVRVRIARNRQSRI